MTKYGCPDCGSTAKKHSDEDCDLAQAAQDYESLEECSPMY